MTGAAPARTFLGMKNPRFSHRLLVPLLFSAAISLALAHLVDLGIQTLGSGSVSTLAVIGNLAGLAACVLSIAYGLRRVSRLPAC
jgi:hypothetical protein